MDPRPIAASSAEPPSPADERGSLALAGFLAGDDPMRAVAELASSAPSSDELAALARRSFVAGLERAREFYWWWEEHVEPAIEELSEDGDDPWDRFSRTRPDLIADYYRVRDDVLQLARATRPTVARAASRELGLNRFGAAAEVACAVECGERARHDLQHPASVAPVVRSRSSSRPRERRGRRRRTSSRAGPDSEDPEPAPSRRRLTHPIGGPS
jgi:hypothetical protein